MQPGVENLPFTRYSVCFFLTLNEGNKKSFVQQLQHEILSLGVKYLVIIRSTKTHDPNNWCFEMHRLGTKASESFFRGRFLDRIRNNNIELGKSQKSFMELSNSIHKTLTV